MKNKKGFTLVEIIVCITLIVIIGTSTFVGFKIYNNKNKTKNKVISEIISAADVYYETNETLKEKLANNYGYLVVNISDLKDNGIIDEKKEVPKLTDKENNEGKSYDKLVIDSTNDSELGLTNIIYPYEKNKNLFLKNLKDITLEYFEKDLLQCNSNLDYIDYLNENYEIEKFYEFSCGKDNFIDVSDITNYKNKTSKINNLDEGLNFVRYKITNSKGEQITDVRKVNINEEYNPSLEAILDDGNTYTCGDWTNKNITIYFNDNRTYTNNDNQPTFKWYKNNTLIDNETNHSFIVTESGIYKGEYKLNGLISDISKIGDENCTVKIDKTPPSINITNSNGKVIVDITDNDSGIYGYYYSQEKQDNLSINDFTKGNKVSFNKPSITYYIYAIDNAGNIQEKVYEVINNDKFPSITYEPIKDSFTKFKITVKDISGEIGYSIDDIKVQFDFDEITSAYTSYKTSFSNDYSYNNLYDTNKKNYIDINNSNYTCSSNECSFIIDMENQINTCGNEYCSKSGYCCRKVVKEYYLDNLSINYYIKATNEKGYSKEIKLNSILNIWRNDKALTEYKKIDNKHKSGLLGTNINGDILYYYYTRDTGDQFGNNVSHVYNIYYYDTKNSKEYTMYRSYTDIEINSFSDNSINFTICEQTGTKKVPSKYNKNIKNTYYYLTYTTYQYNLYTHNTIKKSENTILSEYKCSTSTTTTENIKTQYKSNTYTSKYQNYEVLNRFIDRIANFAKVFGSGYKMCQLDGLESIYYNNIIFNSTENEKEYESIIISEHDNGSSSREWGMLSFIPEVSLLKKYTKTSY